MAKICARAFANKFFTNCGYYCKFSKGISDEKLSRNWKFSILCSRNFTIASNQSITVNNANEQFGKIVNLTGVNLQPTIEDKGESLNYKKLERGSKLLSSYLVHVKSRRQREKSGFMLLEGKRLMQDALDAGVKPIAVFFSRISDVKSLQVKDPNVQLFYTSYKDLQFWSDVATTQGIFGIFSIPDTSQQTSRGKLPLSIICDNVRDPGNMGSIIRTASAVGCQQIFLTKGCVDIWDAKVLRSGAGSHFRTRIFHSMTWEEIDRHTPSNAKLLLADSNVPEPDSEEDSGISVYELDSQGNKVRVNDEPVKRITAYQKRSNCGVPLKLYHEVDYLQPLSLTLVVGGETEGISEAAYEFAGARHGERVYLPLDNGVESLNSGAALGIIAYEIRRQRLVV